MVDACIYLKFHEYPINIRRQYGEKMSHQTELHISSSSSYRAGSTDIPDPLSPLLPIVHRPR